MRGRSSHDESRRRFIKHLSIIVTLPALPFVAFGLSGCSKTNYSSAQSNKPDYPSTLSGGAPCGSCIAPANLSWKTVVNSVDEQGEPLNISGTIYQPDGTTPAAGIVLFIYHTDATGYYNEKDDPGHPRIRGWMQTGTDGRYEFRTIKPAPYPHRTTPAHIHAHVYGAGYSERSIDDYWFEGDPFITAKELSRVNEQGSNPAIIQLNRDGEGVLRGVRDIKLGRIEK
jgi:protocatechuate 3,4-dioxygenase, beta subunit